MTSNTATWGRLSSPAQDGALAMFADSFSGPQHRPFYWPAGETAVLLVHGFPGSPAEMRPLAAALHEAGYSVQGLLLPGFGPAIGSIEQRTPAEWRTAVQDAVQVLRAHHQRVVVLGLSMGAATALQAAAAHPVDGLILVAPFWRLGPDWMTRVWPVMRRIMPRFRPFRVMRPRFDDPRFRAAIQDFLPDADLDDPQVQQAVRDFAVPVTLLDLVGETGAAAFAAAGELPPGPLLVLQGAADEVVTPARTAELRAELPPHAYVELPGDHQLLDGAHAGWEALQTAVLDFLAGVAGANDDE